jgi:hypothetical protein
VVENAAHLRGCFQKVVVNIFCSSGLETKQSHEEFMGVRYIDLKLDHFSSRLSGLAKISKGLLGICNRSINMIGGYPNQPSLNSCLKL